MSGLSVDIALAGTREVVAPEPVAQLALPGAFFDFLTRAGAGLIDVPVESTAAPDGQALFAGLDVEARGAEPLPAAGDDQDRRHGGHGHGDDDLAVAALGWSPLYAMVVPEPLGEAAPMGLCAAGAEVAGTDAGTFAQGVLTALPGEGRGHGREGGPSAADPTAGPSPDAAGGLSPTDALPGLHLRPAGSAEGVPGAIVVPADLLAAAESGLVPGLAPSAPVPASADEPLHDPGAVSLHAGGGARGLAREPTALHEGHAEMIEPAAAAHDGAAVAVGGVDLAAWDKAEDEPSDEAEDVHGRFGEALVSHIADAAAELAGSDPGADAGPSSDGAAPSGGPSGQEDPALRHGSFGHNRAELVFGDGADRVALTVSMDGRGVQVHAQLGSADAASTLLGATDELRRALERHGLQLAGFSASGEGSDASRGDRSGRGSRGDSGWRGARGAERRGVTVRGLDERGGRRGVRVIV